MEPEPEQAGWNYFNYFTEVEEHFQRARGTGLFLMSPLDWALVEGWKNAGLPLEAVLRGIDRSFEKKTRRTRDPRSINSVAYCTQAVQEEAQAMAKGEPARATREVAPPFTPDEVRDFLARNSATLRSRPGYSDVAEALGSLAAEVETHFDDLETLEQRLTALEDKMSAIARATVSDDDLFAMRSELDATLRPYRGKMTADQIAMLERQYLDRRVQEKADLPRLSLFYLK